jgi:hypothetical protein
MTSTGQLAVKVDDKSLWLSENLPFVVRDASLSVVGRGRTGEPAMTLPTGIYSVEAVTPRGRTMQELVRVSPEAPAEVLVTEDSGREAGDPAGADGADGEGMRGAVEVALTGTSACQLLTQDAGGWTFGPDQTLTAVPTATFTVDGREWIASLPLNPQGRKEDEATCRVELDLSTSLPRLGVRFTSQRRVGRAVDGLLRHHEVMAGAELLDDAAELLLGKYQDPAAATLGGLTLHRYGRLRERQSWIENLARDFAWIPDGRILLAALLRYDADPAEQVRGLGLLIDATEARPLYTDGLALATDLLRRWPEGLDTDRAAERKERLERLAAYSCVTDWDSVPLVTGREDQWT